MYEERSRETEKGDEDVRTHDCASRARTRPRRRHLQLIHANMAGSADSAMVEAAVTDGTGEGRGTDEPLAVLLVCPAAARAPLLLPLGADAISMGSGDVVSEYEPRVSTCGSGEMEGEGAASATCMALGVGEPSPSARR